MRCLASKYHGQCRWAARSSSAIRLFAAPFTTVHEKNEVEHVGHEDFAHFADFDASRHRIVGISIQAKMSSTSEAVVRGPFGAEADVIARRLQSASTHRLVFSHRAK